MDIPVPSDTQANIDAAKADVPEASTQDAPEKETTTATPSTSKTTPIKEEPATTVDERSKKIVELITSKQYYLGIKEKHTRHLLTKSASSKKSKKSKKKTVKKTDQKTKKPANKNKSMIQVGVLAVLVLGFIVAIDAGFVDIGVKLPFDLIK